jgi:hypothetical protein
MREPQQCDGQCLDCDFADVAIEGEWREVPVCRVATGEFSWDDWRKMRNDRDFPPNYRKALGLLAAARDGRVSEMWRRSVSAFLDEVGW